MASWASFLSALPSPGRASSVKELFNLFDTHQFREKTLAGIGSINEKLGNIEKQPKENAYKIMN